MQFSTNRNVNHLLLKKVKLFTEAMEGLPEGWKVRFPQVVLVDFNMNKILIIIDHE